MKHQSSGTKTYSKCRQYGRNYVKLMASWINQFNTGTCFRGKVLMVLPNLMLQKPSAKSKDKDHLRTFRLKVTPLLTVMTFELRFVKFLLEWQFLESFYEQSIFWNIRLPIFLPIIFIDNSIPHVCPREFIILESFKNRN